jgi:Ca-activated chloride channel family protein
MLVLGIAALMRPQTTGATESVSSARVSADIVIVLDVSKSMLAEDAAPSRLARAKAEISGMLDELRGHRVGLVAFAGRASVLSPLTPDYGFFRMILRGTDPSSVSRGGTQIGEAIREALAVLRESTSGSKLILLVTDGEDHDSYALDAAGEAKAAGIKIVSIGFGSETGSEITIVDPRTGARSMLTDRDGKNVQSRLDGELLRKIALETEGAYVPAGVAALDLESIVNGHIEPLVAESVETSRLVPGELYPWFVLGSLVCLLISVWLGASGRRRGATR